MELFGIKFNYNQSAGPVNALSIRQNFTTGVAVPEWIKGKNAENFGPPLSILRLKRAEDARGGEGRECNPLFGHDIPPKQAEWIGLAFRTLPRRR